MSRTPKKVIAKHTCPWWPAGRGGVLETLFAQEVVSLGPGWQVTVESAGEVTRESFDFLVVATGSSIFRAENRRGNFRPSENRVPVFKNLTCKVGNLLLVQA